MQTVTVRLRGTGPRSRSTARPCRHLETGRFKYGQIAGAKSARQIEKTVSELLAKIRESERIVATYERQIRRPLGTDFGSLKNTSWTNWSSHNGGR